MQTSTLELQKKFKEPAPVFKVMRAMVLLELQKKFQELREKETLHKYLFNKLSTMDKFQKNKCVLKYNQISETQAEVDLYYDGKKIYDVPLDAKVEIQDGEWKASENQHWIEIIENIFNNGDYYNDIEPLKNDYGLEKKLDFLKAVKGTLYPEINFEDLPENTELDKINKLACNGEIDFTTHYNLLAVIAYEKNPPILTAEHDITDEVTFPKENLENLAIYKIENEYKKKLIDRFINELEFDYALNGKDEYDISIYTIIADDRIKPNLTEQEYKILDDFTKQIQKTVASLNLTEDEKQDCKFAQIGFLMEKLNQHNIELKDIYQNYSKLNNLKKEVGEALKINDVEKLQDIEEDLDNRYETSSDPMDREESIYGQEISKITEKIIDLETQSTTVEQCLKDYEKEDTSLVLS